RPLCVRPRPTVPPLFPYTPLFRSEVALEPSFSQRLLERERLAGGLDAGGIPDLDPPSSGRLGAAHRRVGFAQEDGRFDSVLGAEDRKSTRLNSSHVKISYAVFCLK